MDAIHVINCYAPFAANMKWGADGIYNYQFPQMV